MLDREKVIRAMECCAVGAECDHCPYTLMNKSGHEGCYQMHTDALALLKAQEAVVMAGTELTDAELIEDIRKAPLVLKPNVDAIPVEWLRGYTAVGVAPTGDRLTEGKERLIVHRILNEWQKEQEART